MKILVINGPNINMLGVREPEIYGNLTYEKMCDEINEYGKNIDVDLEFYQSNIEGEIINKIQEAFSSKVKGIVINPGAYTHYSIAIMDALKSIDIPAIEVHISNIHKREEFRHISYPAKACIGQICGLGVEGYKLAINYLSKI
ncbi:MAG: type II 3-dehydroquinate dehydratase [Fusobacteriaceae bacterium]|nr:type II 3-dehydroquinate dehydratase [Fusobacteriaceae bacterium]MBN2838967.1 type II 3-dehydroquinate dehydratase [Fusobacteriaceae bacterium]